MKFCWLRLGVGGGVKWDDEQLIARNFFFFYQNCNAEIITMLLWFRCKLLRWCSCLEWYYGNALRNILRHILRHILRKIMRKMFQWNTFTTNDWKYLLKVTKVLTLWFSLKGNSNGIDLGNSLFMLFFLISYKNISNLFSFRDDTFFFAK